MDSDAVIGRLYKALLEAEEQKLNLITLIDAVKEGDLTLDRITIANNSVSIEPLNTN